jgi:hypothetical protein
VNTQYESAANGFNVVTRQATFVSNSAIKVNRTEEFFEGWRLQNYLPQTVGNNARAIEDNSVVAANKIYKDDGNICHLRTM